MFDDSNTSIKGKGNIYAQRDVHIHSHKDLDEDIKQKLAIIDDNINKSIPHKFEAPRRNREKLAL